MEHIVYLTEPIVVSESEVKFKFKMPQLPADRPDTMYIELLQVQLDIQKASSVELDGLDIRLMTQASNYVSTDNKGLVLGLISYIRYGGGAGNYSSDFAYLTNANPFKLLVNSHQDNLEFNLYRIDNELQTGSINRCKMILKITYPETPKQISNEYRKQIPLPSRLI
jgi:hypothetical protein